ncbi:monocarboxylate transporter 13-like [Amphiura filiformis]|uniref:monocarboxylate transporter 13-like n=1 Tax=Amphiura filiformis TaxID=82378 RepID=UPI003B210A4E
MSFMMVSHVRKRTVLHFFPSSLANSLMIEIDDSMASPNHHHVDHVDSGWAWMIFVAAFNVWFLWEGLLKALSVLLSTLQEQFVTHTWVIGIMVTLMASVREFAAPVVGILASRMSNQILGMTGGILIGFSMILASFADDIQLLVLLLSFVNGIAFSLLMVPCFALLGQYFDKLYPLVASFVYSGGSIGLMVFAPLTQLFLDLYGWRGVLLLLGGLYLHLTISGILFRLPIKQYNQINTTTDLPNAFPTLKVKDEEFEAFSWTSPSKTNSFKEKRDKYLEITGLSLFRNRSFLAISVMMAGTNATYTGWIVYFIPHCLVKGLTPYESSFVAAAAGFAHLIGHIIYLPFLSKNNIRSAIYIACTVAAIPLFLDMFTVTFTTILISNIFYACGMGAAFPLGEVYLKSIVDKDSLAKAFGWRMAIGGVVRTFPGFIVVKLMVLLHSSSGWIYDYTGSYDAGFILLGTLQAISALAVAADHLYQIKENHGDKKH